MNMKGAYMNRIVAAAILLIVPVAGSGQSCSIGSNGNGATCITTAISVPFSIDKTTELLVNSTNTFSLLPSFGALQAADYAAGFYNVANTITVTARSNAPWNATVASTSANFVAPCASKSASQLLWGRATGTRNIAMATTGGAIFTSGTAAATAGLTQQLFFRVNIGWTTDPPNTCNLPLTFAIAAL